MSDFSQGPGWWLASDGKWYAPHLHPSFNPPPPPPGVTDPVAAMTPPESWASNPWGYQPVPGLDPQFAWQGAPSLGIQDPVLFLPLAPWWKRLIAILIDGFVIGTAMFIIFFIIGLATAAGRAPDAGTTTSASGGPIALGLVVLAIPVSLPAGIYYAVMNGSKRGQTVGKLSMSIAVRDARTGGPIGFWRALGRFYITVVFTLLFYVPYVIDALAPLWNKRRQAWHDKAAHSVVVDLKP